MRPPGALFCGWPGFKHIGSKWVNPFSPSGRSLRRLLTSGSSARALLQTLALLLIGLPAGAARAGALETQLEAAGAHPPGDPSRHAGDEREVRDVLGDHGAGRDEGVT